MPPATAVRPRNRFKSNSNKWAGLRLMVNLLYRQTFEMRSCMSQASYPIRLWTRAEGHVPSEHLAGAIARIRGAGPAVEACDQRPCRSPLIQPQHGEYETKPDQSSPGRATVSAPDDGTRSTAMAECVIRTDSTADGGDGGALPGWR